MTDKDCIAFLRWALPRLERSWAGYRKVGGLVCKRLGRRLRSLGLADLAAYRSRLEAESQEWKELDSILGIPVSRFYRDRGVFASLESEVLPGLARAAVREARTTIDLVLCRNVVLTYYAAPVQLQLMRRIADRLRPGGALVAGIHESLPPAISDFKPWPEARGVYVRTAKATGD